jgi:hypothetical protein
MSAPAQVSASKCIQAQAQAPEVGGETAALFALGDLPDDIIHYEVTLLPFL